MPSVLIVDDNATFRAAARGVLEAGGFRVVAEAGSGSAAIEAAARTRPDVVLLDIGLPDMDGFKACQKVLAILPTTMVVLCSVREAEEYGDAVSRSSAAGFLPKASLSGPALSRILAAATNNPHPGHPPDQGPG